MNGCTMLKTACYIKSKIKDNEKTSFIKMMIQDRFRVVDLDNRLRVVDLDTLLRVVDLGTLLRRWSSPLELGEVPKLALIRRVVLR